MRLFRRVAFGVGAAVLTLSSLLTISFPSVAHATPGSDTCLWIGSQSATTFNNSSYWSGCSSGVPVAGDVISLPAGTGSNTFTLTNDLSGNPALGGIIINTTGSGSNYSLFTIDKLHFANNATITSTSGSITITNAVTADGALTFSGNPAFVAGSSNVNVSFTNATYNNAPLHCSGGGGGGGVFSWSPSGTVTVGNGSYYQMMGTESAITVQSGGLLWLPYSTNPVTYGGNITFQGGGATQGTSCTGSNTESLDSNAPTTTLSGTITMSGGNILYNIPYGDQLIITGTLSGTGNSLAAAAASAGTFVNNAATNNSSTPSGSATPSVQTLAPITDSQPSQSLTIASNTIATLDGARGNVFVDPGGVLKGIGTAGSLDVANQGIVAPGHSPGTLTVLQTLTLEGGSTYQAELKDKSAGDFDQIVVGSSSDTTGNDVTLGNGSNLPKLAVSLYTGASIKAGDTFMIINNLSKTAVSGTFSGLPEGATFTVGSGTFKISYVGGDGNDVVLTAMTNITAPNTGFAFISARPSVTLGVTIVAAGIIFGLARKANRSFAPVRVKPGKR